MRNISPQFWTYDDIPLKLYIEIAKTSEIGLMCKAGNATLDQCAICWEEIIKLNNKANSDYSYDVKIRLHRQYNKLLREFITIRATLLNLWCRFDADDIQFLKTKGYFISIESNEKYAESVVEALQRSTNMITKINSKYNELNFNKKSSAGDQYHVSVEELIADISSKLGFEVGSDITLARYNGYKKIIKKKQSTNGRVDK